MNKQTVRLFSLHKIKSNSLRRLAIILTFPLLFVGSIVFVLIGLALFWWQNQRGLFQSAAHYWNSSVRIEDEESDDSARGQS